MGFWGDAGKWALGKANEFATNMAADKIPYLLDDELENKARNGSPQLREMAIDEMRNRPNLSCRVREYENMHLQKCADSNNPDIIYMAIAGYEQRGDSYQVDRLKKKVKEIEEERARREEEKERQKEEERARREEETNKKIVEDAMTSGNTAMVFEQYAAAATFFRLAAERGHVNGMVSLAAVLYQNGETDEAIEWFRKAAELGSVDAQEVLDALKAQGKI